MTATREGGIKTRDKILARNPNHYRELGLKGGTKKGLKGFAAVTVGKKDGLTGRQRAVLCGAISKRRKPSEQ